LNPRFFRNGIVMLLLVVVALAVVLTVVNSTTSTATKFYSEFLNDVGRGSVTQVVQEGSTLTVTTSDSAQPSYTVTVPGLLANQVKDDMQKAVGEGKPIPKLGPSPRLITAGSRS
jgi:hypothetical protein